MPEKTAEWRPITLAMRKRNGVLNALRTALKRTRAVEGLYASEMREARQLLEELKLELDRKETYGEES